MRDWLAGRSSVGTAQHRPTEACCEDEADARSRRNHRPRPARREATRNERAWPPALSAFSPAQSRGQASAAGACGRRWTTRWLQRGRRASARRNESAPAHKEHKGREYARPGRWPRDEAGQRDAPSLRPSRGSGRSSTWRTSWKTCVVVEGRERTKELERQSSRVKGKSRFRSGCFICPGLLATARAPCGGRLRINV